MFGIPWQGLCDDCFKPRDVMVHYSGPLVPQGTSGDFCEECLGSRRFDVKTGRPIREIGILAETREHFWVDLKDLEVTFKDDGPSMRVKLKVFKPIDMVFSDESRLRMPIRIKPEDSSKWFFGENLWLVSQDSKDHCFRLAAQMAIAILTWYYFPLTSERLVEDIQMIMEEPLPLAPQ